jgi:hypothetical protein
VIACLAVSLRNMYYGGRCIAYIMVILIIDVDDYYAYDYGYILVIIVSLACLVHDAHIIS